MYYNRGGIQNVNIISKYYGFYYFLYQINTALVSKEDLVPNFWTVVYVDFNIIQDRNHY